MDKEKDKLTTFSLSIYAVKSKMPHFLHGCK